MKSIENFFCGIWFILKNNRKIRLLSSLLAILTVLTITLSITNNVKTVTTISNMDNIIQDLDVVIGGQVAGIKILASGVLVIGVDDVHCGVREGDIILSLDDVNVESNADIVEYINMKKVVSHGSVNAKIMRKDKIINKEISLKYSVTTQKYELGLWVKDSSAGIGTITFYEKTKGYYAGLGHGITETRESIVVPINTGAIVKASIESIKKGVPKEAGDIKGIIYKDVIGNIYKNTLNGIYGKLENIDDLKNKESIKVARKSEIKTGKAYIYCTLDNNQVSMFEIKINSVLLDSISNKNMIIQITDKALIEKTGGIVQGMSGSPIVQDGKLIGAVTHVFLNDPTKGYAVFAENMVKDLVSTINANEEWFGDNIVNV